MMALSESWIRVICLFLPALILLDIWLWKLPRRREAIGAGLSFLWTLPSLLIVNVIAVYFELWEFSSDQVVFLGIPIELFIGWSILWGPIPLIAFPYLPLTLVLAIMFVIDLLFMPLISPVLVLGKYWIVGEVLALAMVLVPAQLFGRWTRDQTRLFARGLLQVICFTGIVGLLIPAIISAWTTDSISIVFDLPLWQNALFFFLFTWSLVLGFSAVWEFVQVGRGTPLPFDPPRRLVVSGLYRYLRNPMQVSMVLVLVILAFWIGSYWIFGIGVIGFIYSVGFAAWSEEIDLRERFGSECIDYFKEVKPWIPRLEPRVKDVATLYYSVNCGLCSELALIIGRMSPIGLQLVPAEEHPSKDLNRISYELAELDISDQGIVAIARALEHTNLAWAIFASFMRLPLIRWVLQLITDAIGGGPRQVCRIG